LLKEIVDLLLLFAEHTGYFGVYLYMFLVGTFIPVPSEILLIPSGYLASTGQKNLILLIIFGALGSLSGALFNYYFAKFIARKFVKRRLLARVTKFFRRHGKISVFLAPLTPGLGQYISIPAGLSHMKLSYFIPLTLLANTIWVSFMLLIGYIFGEGAKAHKSAFYFSLILFAAVIVVASIYVLREIKKDKR